MNTTSRNRLSTANRMLTVAWHQQRDRNCEQHTEARAWLTDQDRHQQRDRNCEQHAEARAWLTYQDRHQ